MVISHSYLKLPEGKKVPREFPLVNENHGSPEVFTILAELYSFAFHIFETPFNRLMDSMKSHGYPEAVSSVLQLLFVVIMINHYVGTMDVGGIVANCQKTERNRLKSASAKYGFSWIAVNGASRAPFFVQHV